MISFPKTWLMVLLIFICQSSWGVAKDKIPVFVSIIPQKYFVEQIGRQWVDVRVMVQPGASPATYEPKPKQMIEISRAKIYFAIGVAFEKAWLEKIASTNPDMMLIHTDREIQKIPMTVFHDHGGPQNDDSSDHGTLDPHIWLSPPLVKLQAHTILKALQQIDPDHSVIYETNFKEFESMLDGLDTQLKNIFAKKQGLGFMVFHPAWGVFAHTYGLNQVPIELEGKSPKPAQLEALILKARQKNIKVIFVQPQFSVKNASQIAREINGQVVFADPLAEDWAANLKDVARKFDAALR